MQSVFQFIPTVFGGVKVSVTCRTPSSFTLNLANHVFIKLALCTKALSC